jgi:antitoxin component of RelBE/YafQ-DinJ toxin-antitoxin module
MSLVEGVATLSVRIPVELKASIQADAKAAGLSVADVIRLRLNGLALPQPSPPVRFSGKDAA